MRSEKEIKEKNFEDFYSDCQHRAIAKTILWVLEGKPRYSVAELEKLGVLLDVDEDMELYTTERGFYDGALKDLKRILKKKNKVEDILK